jgi:hypothetical protein
LVAVAVAGEQLELLEVRAVAVVAAWALEAQEQLDKEIPVAPEPL